MFWGEFVHFFYLDESGCSGDNLQDSQEPLFVLGGISVKDQGWVTTYKKFEQILLTYFNIPSLPENFELHANHLLSPNGEGEFLGHDRVRRNQLVFDILDLLSERSHNVHFLCIDKRKLATKADGNELSYFDSRKPYLLCYDYLVRYIDYYVKDKLGHTARGMMIIDIKEQYQEGLEKITHYRRFEEPQSKRLKWLVEFTYPVDSVRHPMIQFSDLVIYCIRKFLEVESGYRDNWPNEAKLFYKECYQKISNRIVWKTLKVTDSTRAMRRYNQLLKDTYTVPRRGWENRY